MSAEFVLYRSPGSKGRRQVTPIVIIAFVAIVVVFSSGCGTVEESTDGEMTGDMDSTPYVSHTARLEFRIDSLTSEVRRVNQQIDALAAENRSLTARNAELEMKLKEIESPPPPAQVSRQPAPAADMSTGYSRALAEYQRKSFSGAVAAFEALLKSGIQDDLADNCHYWVGESYYGMGRYSEAISHFDVVLDYKKSEKKDDALLMIGNCYATMGNTAAARDAYNKLISSYPASSFAQRARDKLARLK